MFRASCKERQDKCDELAAGKEALQHEVDGLKDSVEQLSINAEQLQVDLQDAQAALQSCEAAKTDAEVWPLNLIMRLKLREVCFNKAAHQQFQRQRRYIQL